MWDGFGGMFGGGGGGGRPASLATAFQDRVFGFWVLGFWVLGFWVLGFWVLGFWVLGFWVFGFWVLGFWVLGLGFFGGGGWVGVWVWFGVCRGRFGSLGVCGVALGMVGGWFAAGWRHVL